MCKWILVVEKPGDVEQYFSGKESKDVSPRCSDSSYILKKMNHYSIVSSSCKSILRTSESCVIGASVIIYADRWSEAGRGLECPIRGWKFQIKIPTKIQ
jgi:hypothetical protein